jgi:hypothetical protein
MLDVSVASYSMLGLTDNPRASQAENLLKLARA